MIIENTNKTNKEIAKELVNSKGKEKRSSIKSLKNKHKETKEEKVKEKEIKNGNEVEHIVVKKIKKEKQIGLVEYYDFENSKLILSYGPQIYDYSRQVEGLLYNLKDSEVKFFDILKNHNISPSVRTKLIDWLFEVFYAYKCEENTIYLTVYILDAFLYRCKEKLGNSDIHLIGISCLSLASKFEDIYPIDLNTMKLRIAHGKFSEKEIQKKEIQILENIDYRLIFASMHDFIRNFIYDFQFNNKKVINKLKFKNEISILEKTAIYISKIILHTDLFSGLKSSIKGIACLILAFDLVRTNVSTFTGEIENFTNEWIKFLVEQSRYEPDSIFQIYNKIKEYFEGFDKTPLIEHNLKNNLDLPF